jgi:hypothetical protein
MSNEKDLEEVSGTIPDPDIDHFHSFVISVYFCPPDHHITIFSEPEASVGSNALLADIAMYLTVQ